MTEVTGSAGSLDSRADIDPGDAGTVSFWLTQDKIAAKEERSWVKQARKIVKRYRDERPDNSADVHKFNILWSNVQTLKPALYARTPKADVERRFKDADPTGRLASILLERALEYSLEASDLDSIMDSVVSDRLLPGRGVARVMYVPHFGDPIKEDANESDTADAAGVVANAGDMGAQAPSSETGGDASGGPTLPSSGDGKSGASESNGAGSVGGGGSEDQPAPAEAPREVVYEEARIKYEFWEDYREAPARVWAEVNWVRYRAYLTQDELKDRFGKKKAALVNLDFTPKGSESSETGKDGAASIYKKAEIWEIWDKTKREVIWIAPGTPDLVLDKKADPLKLSGFFPNPDPLLATTTTDKRIPVPDYIQYQDQAIEIDTLTQRINKLTEALRVAGVYAADEKQSLQRLFDAGDNTLIPVEGWAAFAGDKGGLKDLILWLPIQQVAEVVIQLYSARDRSKQILYEVTGIADIIRGSTNPNETATAQGIKAQYATMRLSATQKSVANFARDLIRLTAGVIAEHFSPQTISLITGYPQLLPVPPLPPMPQAPQPSPMAQPMPQRPPMPGQPPQAPQPQPDPAVVAYQQAMAQWKQMAAQVQQVQAQNAELQKQFLAAVDMLKKDAAHDFKIDIEADSTIAVDEDADKKSRTEFLGAVIPLLEQVVPLAQGKPEMANLMKEIVMFGIRGFRVARTLEETFEKALDAIGQLQPPQPEGGDKGAAPSKPDNSQAENALDAKAIDSKTQLGMQANAIKDKQVTGELALGAAREQRESEDARSHLAVQAASLALKERSVGARVQHMEAENAEGLQ